MKNLFTIILLPVLVFSSCQQQKAKAHQDAINDMMEKYGDPDAKKKADNQTASAKPVSDEIANSGLMGEWKTVLVTGDNNSNGILDPEEKEKGFTTYNDYMKLNPDGTCEFTQAHIEAVYEIIEKDGHKSIEIIVRDGTRMKQGRIISLKPDELQLMKFSGGRDILVYNRP